MSGKTIELAQIQMSCTFTATPGDMGLKDKLTLKQFCDNGAYMESVSIRRSTDTWRVENLSALNLIKVEFPGVEKACKVVEIHAFIGNLLAYKAYLLKPRTLEEVGDVLILNANDLIFSETLQGAD